MVNFPSLAYSEIPNAILQDRCRTLGDLHIYSKQIGWETFFKWKKLHLYRALSRWTMALHLSFRGRDGIGYRTERVANRNKWKSHVYLQPRNRDQVGSTKQAYLIFSRRLRHVCNDSSTIQNHCWILHKTTIREFLIWIHFWKRKKMIIGRVFHCIPWGSLTWGRKPIGQLFVSHGSTILFSKMSLKRLILHVGPTSHRPVPYHQNQK